MILSRRSQFLIPPRLSQARFLHFGTIRAKLAPKTFCWKIFFNKSTKSMSASRNRQGYERQRKLKSRASGIQITINGFERWATGEGLSKGGFGVWLGAPASHTHTFQAGLRVSWCVNRSVIRDNEWGGQRSTQNVRVSGREPPTKSQTPPWTKPRFNPSQ